MPIYDTFQCFILLTRRLIVNFDFDDACTNFKFWDVTLLVMLQIRNIIKVSDVKRKSRGYDL